MRKLAVVIFSILIFMAGVAQSKENVIDLIDEPTAEILDYGSYNVNFRLFSEGGVLSRLNFGVFKVVNLGFSWEIQKLIGAQNPSVAPPSLYLKIRPFSGTMEMPSFAFGYDGQGYFYNSSLDEFAQKGKGVFVVFSKEMFFSNFEMNFGANINDFKKSEVYAFSAASFSIEEKIMLIAEYDNIHYSPENRLNAGLRFVVTDDLSIDLAGRDLISKDRNSERILKINYVGRF